MYSDADMSSTLLRLDTNIEPVLFPYPWNNVKRGPSASTPSRRSRSRAPSIWSTSSICSDDSLADDDDNSEADSNESESLFSAPSPTTTCTTASSWSWSSPRPSSCADPYSLSNDGASLLSQPSSPHDLRFPREKPRGPRSRPLPTLPTHRPASFSSPSSPLASHNPVTPSTVALSSRSQQLIHQQQPAVVVSAPRELKQSTRRHPRTSAPSRAQKEHASFQHALKVASEEDYIDWERIQDIMCYSDG